MGINVGGPMDLFAMKVANMLVANATDSPVLEMHFPAAQILFEQNALISITGGEFGATLNGEPVPSWKPLVVKRKSVLIFARRERGARCYLAVHGGFCVQKWLNSASTNLRAKAGGWHGRKLEKGDEVSFGETHFYYPLLLREKSVAELPWSVDYKSVYDLPHEVACIPGKEYHLLTEESRQKLLQSNFMIHPSSDRMGYNLRGPEINVKENFQLVSSAVSFGTIQLLPNNQLIVLMADHQTTGGYPVIANVINADISSLAQKQPGTSLKFSIVSVEEAEQLYITQQQYLQQLQDACNLQLKQFFS